MEANCLYLRKGGGQNSRNHVWSNWLSSIKVLSCMLHFVSPAEEVVFKVQVNTASLASSCLFSLPVPEIRLFPRCHVAFFTKWGSASFSSAAWSSSASVHGSSWISASAGSLFCNLVILDSSVAIPTESYLTGPILGDGLF